VLQLPYVPFLRIRRSWDDRLRPLQPYLESTRIHWSYGAVKGRPDARWIARVSGTAGAAACCTIRKSAFAGIWVDRAGYADHGAAIVASLTRRQDLVPLRRRMAATRTCPSVARLTVVTFRAGPLRAVRHSRLQTGSVRGC